jgi:uncharacterized protein with von Willebrand factor type A (vWA) domain
MTACGRTTSRRHSERIATQDVLHKYGNDYKLIFVGDASMSPYETMRWPRATCRSAPA